MTRFAPLALVTCFIGFLAGPAAAQQTYFDTEGRMDKPDLFETDGFRPVWQQQLMEQRAKEEAAKAAEAAKQNETGAVPALPAGSVPFAAPAQPATSAQPKATATTKAKQ